MVRAQMAELGFQVKLLKMPGAPDVVYGTMKGEQELRKP